jgi:hypothetical protein
MYGYRHPFPSHSRESGAGRRPAKELLQHRNARITSMDTPDLLRGPAEFTTPLFAFEREFIILIQLSPRVCGSVGDKMLKQDVP